LGFAIATDVKPDILILDEVLSVGDESFKHKCQARMDKLWDQHTTILVVSHGLEFIQESCERAIWLDRGKIRFSGSTEDTISHYLEAVKQSEIHHSPL
jgi:lipopolysaccharide transport system ATP-binding protein